MSGNFGFSSPMQPLSIGNVVSAAIRLYRSHFKQYLGLEFQAILWGIIPVYGWAKYHTINAMIARLAFAELVNQPEGLQTTRQELRPRLWNFFLVQILVGLIGFGVNFGLSIVQQILIVIFASAFGSDSALYLITVLVIQLAGLIVYLWFYSHIFVPELPIAVEDILDAGQGIARSWELTKGNVWRLQAIILLASLITLPLMFIAVIPFFFAIGYLVASVAVNRSEVPSTEALGAFLISLLVGLILILLASILVTPFWQAIKAVVYYDLRGRREGLGLKLRDHEI